jgi:hypothetical protein
MLLVLKPCQFVKENVILHDPVNNHIFNDSTFARIIYSNNIITTNGIYMKLDIKGASVEKKYNKSNISFNIYNNRELIATMQSIEEQILLGITNKKCVYSLNNELISGRISVHDFRDIIVLKVSGVWETELNCGIIYKLIPA